MKKVLYTLILIILAAPNIFAEEQTRAEQVTRALARAYPRQIQQVEFRNGDWAVLLRDTWYFYAEGRMLPENLTAKASDYNRLPFYSLPAELPEWVRPNKEEEERFRNFANNRRQNRLRRPAYFFDDLWQAGSRSESYDRVKTIRFLQHPVTVHYLILEHLSLVEMQITSDARNDPQVQEWVNSISRLEGWSWRDIAETQSRSYHSYGLAVDIIPKSYNGMEAYWLWTISRREDWWNIPYSQRYHPPQAVIAAFEKYGFIWGGKWSIFDTIHFEYRPEILILSGRPPEIQR